MSQNLIAVTPFIEMQKVKVVTNPVSSSSQLQNNTAKCPDCDSVMEIPCDAEAGEILSCPTCGLELEVKKTGCGGGCVELQELNIEGEDWGE